MRVMTRTTGSHTPRRGQRPLATLLLLPKHPLAERRVSGKYLAKDSLAAKNSGLQPGRTERLTRGRKILAVDTARSHWCEL